MKQQLTVAEAKEQGYTHFGYSDEGYQAMVDLVDFRPEEAEGKARLFNKDPDPPYQTNAERVKEILSDQLSEDWDSEVRDDTNEMSDFLNDIPEEKFNEITELLNDAMANKHYYKLSDIKLIPNPS
jgi:molecular chaperone DnaK (HSP70)